MKSFRIITVTALATVFVAAAASPANATDTGNQVGTGFTITAGDRTATLAGDVTFPTVAASHNMSFAPTQSSVLVDDLSGTGAGWNATVSASPLVHTASGTNLDTWGLFVWPNQTTAFAGDPTGVDRGMGGNLQFGDQLLVSASATHGMGTYEQAFDVHLFVPANALSGAYTGTLTVTIAPPV